MINEFALIERFFKPLERLHADIVYGIGDDAACVKVPAGYDLLISTDTLVADVHFLKDWDAYDIAYKAVVVNLSDIAAMAAKPAWVTLALTLPELNIEWLERFTQGLAAALKQFDLALIGGDTTRGPLSLSLTIHGLAPQNQARRRSGACPGDKIYLSGELGAAAMAVNFLEDKSLSSNAKEILIQKLKHPYPRLDFAELLRTYATAVIDISDGFSADLNHICEASRVGALLNLKDVPIHLLVSHYQPKHALALALNGGDDYELCFTIPAQQEENFLALAKEASLKCYLVGSIEAEPGLRFVDDKGVLQCLKPEGYKHF